MNTITAGRPKILPWLAKKAGISEDRANALWRAAQRYAAQHTDGAETSDYWTQAMDRLLELVAAEALREDAASFGFRRWSRLQARLIQAPVAAFDALALSSARGWRLWGRLNGPWSPRCLSQP